MKTLILVCTLLLLGGCVRTTVKAIDGNISVNRTAVLYPFKVEGLEYDPTNKIFSIRSYDTDGGSELAEGIAKGVAEGVAKGLKP